MFTVFMPIISKITITIVTFFNVNCCEMVLRFSGLAGHWSQLIILFFLIYQRNAMVAIDGQQRNMPTNILITLFFR